VEREREIGTLREGLDRACAGEGTLLLIEGPAGVGKTELTREARIAAERAGIARLQARGSELEQPFAFGAVRQLLEPVIGNPSRGIDLFAGAAAPAARFFELEERRLADADVGFEALHSLYWLVVNLADHTPALVLVDDCQWVDRDSLRFLAYLAQRVEDPPIAMVLAGRSPDSTVDEATALWGQIAARPAAIAMYPRPLSESAAITFTRERLGTEAAEEFCRSCHIATGGNPLFLGELLRALEAAGIVPSADAAGEVQEVGPAAVSRFVLHRLAVLGATATELARAVAVLGDDSELTLAARVAGVSEELARAAGDELVRADIFSRAERLGFVHPIVRAALYEDLTPGERQALHAAAAQALALEGASPERVTAHLLMTGPTGDPQRVETLRAAAISAARRGAPRAAVVRLCRALLEAPSPPLRAEILTQIGRYEVAAMEFASAEEHLSEALATTGAALATRAEAASWLGRCALVSGGQGADAAAHALATLSQELAPQDVEHSLQLGAELLPLKSVTPRMRPDLPAELDRFTARAKGHAGFEAVARLFSAQERLFKGGRADDAVSETLAAFATGLPPATVNNAGLMALLTLGIGEAYDVAQRLLEAALERARSEGNAARQGIIHGLRSAIALLVGSLHDAQVEAETGLMLVEEPHFAVLQLVATAIVVHVERGELGAAAELARDGERLALSGTQAYAGDYMAARGRLRIAEGDVEAGVADLFWCGEHREARGQLWPSDWKTFAAPALASLGENARAAELARDHWPTTSPRAARPHSGARRRSRPQTATPLTPSAWIQPRTPLCTRAASALSARPGRAHPGARSIKGATPWSGQTRSRLHRPAPRVCACGVAYTAGCRTAPPTRCGSPPSASSLRTTPSSPTRTPGSASASDTSVEPGSAEVTSWVDSEASVLSVLVVSAAGSRPPVDEAWLEAREPENCVQVAAIGGHPVETILTVVLESEHDRLPVRGVATDERVDLTAAEVGQDPQPGSVGCDRGDVR
jgi:hypothetical protein